MTLSIDPNLGTGPNKQYVIVSTMGQTMQEDNALHLVKTANHVVRKITLLRNVSLNLVLMVPNAHSIIRR